MVFHLDTDLPRELAPLAWLIGRWEGAGVVGYPTIESAHFGQEVEVTHDGRPFLEWQSRTWLLDDAGEKVRPLATELGFWRPVEEGRSSCCSPTRPASSSSTTALPSRPRSSSAPTASCAARTPRSTTPRPGCTAW